jgi:hypothetical protein
MKILFIFTMHLFYFVTRFFPGGGILIFFQAGDFLLGDFLPTFVG